MTATLPTSSTTYSCPFGSAVKATSGQDWAGEIEASDCVARRNQRFLPVTHDTDTFTTPPLAQVSNLSRPPAWATVAGDQQQNGETIPKPSPGETRRAAKKAPDDYRYSEGIGGDPDVHHLVVFIDRTTQHGWKQPSVSNETDRTETIIHQRRTCQTGGRTHTTARRQELLNYTFHTVVRVSHILPRNGTGIWHYGRFLRDANHAGAPAHCVQLL